MVNREGVDTAQRRVPASSELEVVARPAQPAVRALARVEKASSRPMADGSEGYQATRPLPIGVRGKVIPSNPA